MGEELEGDEGKDEKNSGRCVNLLRGLTTNLPWASYKQQLTRMRELEYNPLGQFPGIAEEHRALVESHIY